jgi:hypothetical protein
VGCLITANVQSLDLCQVTSVAVPQILKLFLVLALLGVKGRVLVNRKLQLMFDSLELSVSFIDCLPMLVQLQT